MNLIEERPPDQAPPIENEQDAPPSTAFVRQSLRPEPELHEVLVPIQVEEWGVLDLIGPDESNENRRTFHETDWSQSSEGIVTLVLGITNGFGGVASKVRLDARAKIALISASTFTDFGPPFERYWDHLKGRVKINNWDLDADTRVEVDVSGKLRGEVWSLHLCRELRDEPR